MKTKTNLETENMESKTLWQVFSNSKYEKNSRTLIFRITAILKRIPAFPEQHAQNQGKADVHDSDGS